MQPLEGQERLSPVLTTGHEILPDSAGPGGSAAAWRVEGRTLTEPEDTVMSYCCDRARSITWGIEGGLPSIPHGVWLTRKGPARPVSRRGVLERRVVPGDVFTRPSAGGGGYGDPLDRDPEAVLEDVVDGYVTIARACKDYGVVVREVDAELAEYEVDSDATERERERIRGERAGWLEEDAEPVAERYREGELDTLDLVRRYGVILDWGTGELLAKTTETFRAMLQRRAVEHWQTG